MTNVVWSTLPSKASLCLWHHHCLGQISVDTSLRMVQSKAITGIEVVGDRSQSCSACHKGKQTQNMIPKATEERSSEILGRVFSDICGPIDSSIEGYQYFITFTNDF